MKTTSTVLLLALTSAIPSSTPETKYFRYARPVSVPNQTGQTCLAVDPSIFPHAAPQLADLRLYSGSTETPYVLRTIVPTENTPQPIQPLNRGTHEGETVFDAKLPEITYSDLDLDIDAKDFIATVNVSGSQSAGGASTKIGSYTVFDLSKQKLGRSSILHLPDSTFRYLHFAISGSLTPENITSLSVSRIPAKEPNYQTVATSTQITTKNHATLIEFDVPAQTPVDRVTFKPGTEPRLFSRDVSITVTPINPQESQFNDGQPLPRLAFAGTLLRIHTQQQGHKIDEERLSIGTPATLDYRSKWIINVNNGDDQPISLHAVGLEMLERSLCFDARADTAYALFYGDPALNAPSYDYARLFEPDVAPATASLSPEQLNPVYQPRPDERPFTEKHPILLWTALIAVIALLGFIALRSIKATPPTP